MPSIWSKCKNCRRRDAALPKNGTFHGKCVENGDQMLINQHQLWDFARNSEIFGSEVHPGYCGGPWQLAGYPFKFRAFWPPHGLVVFTSKVKRLNILWQTNWFHMTFTIFTARPTFTPLKALYSSDMSLLCQLLISRSQRSLRIVLSCFFLLSIALTM